MGRQTFNKSVNSIRGLQNRCRKGLEKWSDLSSECKLISYRKSERPIPSKKTKEWDPGCGSPCTFSQAKQKESNFWMTSKLSPKQQIIHNMFDNEDTDLQSETKMGTSDHLVLFGFSSEKNLNDPSFRPCKQYESSYSLITHDQMWFRKWFPCLLFTPSNGRRHTLRSCSWLGEKMGTAQK